ncbi:hypothetical protein V3C99_008736 [Haemonchus contortus]
MDVLNGKIIEGNNKQSRNSLKIRSRRVDS